MKVKYGEAVVSIIADRSPLERDLPKAERTVDTFTGKVQRRINSISFARVAAAATAFAAATTYSLAKIEKQFASFETALVDMGKVTDEPLEQIRNNIMAMDSALGSATEQVRAYYQVISAGVTEPVAAMKTLEVSAKAAKIAHVAQFEVIRGLTKFMAGYGDQLRDVARAADYLFGIEKAGQTTFAELIPYIGGMSLLARELNISVTELGGAFAEVTQTAGDTAEASTRLERLMVEMFKPTDTMKETIKKFGYESAQAMIKERGFVDTLKMLVKWAEGSAEKLAMLFERKEALMAITSLMTNNFEGLNKRIMWVADSAGVTERIFAQWKGTLEGVWNTFKNKLGRVIIEIGENLAPKVKELITSTGEWVEANKRLIETGIVDFYETMIDAVQRLADVAKKNPDMMENLIKISTSALGIFAKAVELLERAAEGYIKLANITKGMPISHLPIGMGYQYKGTQRTFGVSGSFARMPVPMPVPTISYSYPQAAAAAAGPAGMPFTGGLGVPGMRGTMPWTGRLGGYTPFDPYQQERVSIGVRAAAIRSEINQTSMDLMDLNKRFVEASRKQYEIALDNFYDYTDTIKHTWAYTIQDLITGCKTFALNFENLVWYPMTSVISQRAANYLVDQLTKGMKDWPIFQWGGQKTTGGGMEYEPGAAYKSAVGGAGKVAVGGGVTVNITGPSADQIVAIVDDNMRNNGILRR